LCTRNSQSYAYDGKNIIAAYGSVYGGVSGLEERMHGLIFDATIFSRFDGTFTHTSLTSYWHYDPSGNMALTTDPVGYVQSYNSSDFYGTNPSPSTAENNYQAGSGVSTRSDPQVDQTVNGDVIDPGTARMLQGQSLEGGDNWFQGEQWQGPGWYFSSSCQRWHQIVGAVIGMVVGGVFNWAIQTTVSLGDLGEALVGLGGGAAIGAAIGAIIIGRALGWEYAHSGAVLGGAIGAALASQLEMIGLLSPFGRLIAHINSTAFTSLPVGVGGLIGFNTGTDFSLQKMSGLPGIGCWSYHSEPPS
jgi:hypothetical protein